MLETKKRDAVDRHVVLNNLRKQVSEDGGDAENGEVANHTSLQHALHAARENERSLRQRLHRVHDLRGMELLRDLRARISCMEQLLSESDRED